jgi:hypothetical protein
MWSVVIREGCGDLLLFRAKERCVIVCVDAEVRMLNLNLPVISGGTADEEVYKVLVYDNFCRDLLAPLIRVNDLRKHGDRQGAAECA